MIVKRYKNCNTFSLSYLFLVMVNEQTSHKRKWWCGSCISAYAFRLDDELDFISKIILFIRKWLGVTTYFCFIFKRVNKIRKKTLSVTPYYWKRWFVKNRIGFGSHVTHREGMVKTVPPLLVPKVGFLLMKWSWCDNW